ncbi:hypothetical protein GW17_00053474 [Ensete ventricosum]|nr:hypothetical protein GW17_00053474 [Ensete ventricosum]
MELQPDYGQRSSLGIRPGSNDVVGPRWEFASRFVEGIGKLAGKTPGDHRKKARRITTRMLEATKLVGVSLIFGSNSEAIWGL